MPDVTVTITMTNRELLILNKVATANGMTSVDYAKSIVKGFIRGQIRGAFQTKFDSKTFNELAVLFGELT